MNVPNIFISVNLEIYGRSDTVENLIRRTTFSALSFSTFRNKKWLSSLFGLSVYIQKSKKRTEFNNVKKTESNKIKKAESKNVKKAELKFFLATEPRVMSGKVFGPSKKSKF